MVEGEMAKLRKLLGYWIEHNKEHGQEFREWAEQAKALGEPEAGEDMLAAAREMKGDNKLLSQALKRVTKRGS